VDADHYVSFLRHGSWGEAINADIRDPNVHDPGNVRLLTRLLTQMERVLTISGLQQFSVAIVRPAREKPVIGQA